MTTKKSNRGRKPTPANLVQTAKILRMNGMGYRRIADSLGIATGTAHHYCKDVTVLPKKMRKNPFDIADDWRATAISGEADPQAFKNNIEKSLEYWKEEHTPGERFRGPVDSIPLKELIELMKEPTAFHSQLNFEEWFNHYLAEPFFGPGCSLSETQVKINNFLDKYDRALVKVFRDVGKTSLINGRFTYLICENRNKSYAIQSRESSVSVKRVTQIQREFMTNKRLIADYGYLPHEKKWGNVSMSWKQSELTVKREINKVDPTLMALSWKDTKMLGGHYDGVGFDDPWSEKLERRSEANKEKWFGWYDGTFQGCLNPGAFEHFICTPKGTDDIYKELENRGTFAVYTQPAILQYPSRFEYVKDENGVIIGVDVQSDDYELSDDCNGRFDIEFWLMKKKSVSPLKWEQEWQINPMPPKGLVLNWDDLQFLNSAEEFNEIKGDGYAKYIGAMDLAFGITDRADYTSLVIGSYYDGKYYILDGWAVRGLSKGGKVALMKKAKSQFPELEVIYIEADYQQSKDFRELKGMVDFVQILPIFSRQEELRLKKHSNLGGKEVRILSQFDTPLESHSIFINKNMTCFDEFAKEFRSFPRGNHDDVLDAIGSCISKMGRTKALLFGLSG